RRGGGARMAASAPARAHGVALQLRRHRDCDLIAGRRRGPKRALGVLPSPTKPRLAGVWSELDAKISLRTRLLPSPPVGRGWGWGSLLGGHARASPHAPTRLASLATLPTRGRVGPSSPLALIPFHLNTLLCGRQPATLLL